MVVSVGRSHRSERKSTSISTWSRNSWERNVPTESRIISSAALGSTKLGSSSTHGDLDSRMGSVRFRSCSSARCSRDANSQPPAGRRGTRHQ